MAPPDAKKPIEPPTYTNDIKADPRLQELFKLASLDIEHHIKLRTLPTFDLDATGAESNVAKANAQVDKLKLRNKVNALLKEEALVQPFNRSVDATKKWDFYFQETLPVDEKRAAEREAKEASQAYHNALLLKAMALGILEDTRKGPAKDISTQDNLTANLKILHTEASMPQWRLTKATSLIKNAGLADAKSVEALKKFLVEGEDLHAQFGRPQTLDYLLELKQAGALDKLESLYKDAEAQSLYKSSDREKYFKYMDNKLSTLAPDNVRLRYALRKLFEIKADDDAKKEQPQKQQGRQQIFKMEEADVANLGDQTIPFGSKNSGRNRAG